ncbi:hypothetical protein TCAL_08776 [Tigriopus californicus]|uniref:Uncharacterized protein n=1 Tax=Tigriopus californicus TaxID=6832 RepID=A0A553PIA3_TIGCA|nr:hypothetical protein TCAL_08776 [Tigriopus californicus]
MTQPAHPRGSLPNRHARVPIPIQRGPHAAPSFAPFFQRLTQRQIRGSSNPYQASIQSRSLPIEVNVPQMEDESPSASIEGSKMPVDPGQFEKESLEWNMAMIKYLLALKGSDHAGPHNQHPVVSRAVDDMGLNQHEIEVPPPPTVPVICKMEPFNICYRVNDRDQSVHTVGNRRPVRLLRVY